ncbi:MAG: hypothetical protein WDO17_14655 [Alphaproteobacteria bacterium]
MAKESADAVVRLLQEIWVAQQFQGEVLGSISGSLTRLEWRFRELGEALARSAGVARVEMRQ